MVRIKKLKYRNVFGFEEQELDIGDAKDIAVIGPNESGKTRTLHSILLAFGGACTDKDILTQGAESGDVWVLLDNGTEIERPVTGSGAGRAVVRQGEHRTPIKQPESFLKPLLTSMTFNPVEFLLAQTDKERIDLFIRALPVSFEPARVFEVTGGLARPNASCNLAELEDIRSNIFKDRTAVNAHLDRAKKSIVELTPSLPASAANADEIRKDLAYSENLARELTGSVEAHIATLSKQVDAEVAAKTKTMNEAIAKLRADQSEFEKGLRTAEQTEVESIRAENADELSRITTRISELKEQIKSADRASGLVEHVQSLRKDATSLKQKADAHTDALDAIDGLKRDALKNSNLGQFEIRDGGALYVEDQMQRMVPFDQANTERQVRLALRLARMKLGDLKVLFVDGVESLVGDRRTAFFKECIESDVQHFIAWAEKGDRLRVLALREAMQAEVVNQP